MIDHPLRRGEGRLDRLRELVRARPLAAPLALVGLVAGAALARLWLSHLTPTPFIFIDELLHSELAKNVEEHGRYLVRGQHVTVSFVYPAAIAPAWLASSMQTAYEAAKTINSVLMALAAVPVYVWGRRFLAPRFALLAAGLTLLLPAYALVGTLMTENAFFPVFLLALPAIAWCVERPTPARQALALGAIGLAGATRVQGLILLAVLPAAAAIVSRRTLVRLWPSALVVALAVVACVSWKAASGEPLTALGVYSGVAPAHYSAWGVTKWAAYALGELALTTAFAPVAALLLLMALPPRSLAERSFLAVGASSLLALLVLAGFAAFWNPPGLKDRYLFHAIPVLFLALALWFERGLPRPLGRTTLAVLLPFWLLAALPLRTLFESPALLGNGLGLVAFERIAGSFGGNGGLKAGILIAALIAAGIFALAPRRLAPPALVAGLTALLLLSSFSLVRAMRAESRSVRDLAALGPRPSWIDDRIGSGADAAYLNATNFVPDSADWWPQWVPVWESEFWNRSLKQVVSLGLREPAPLYQPDARLDWANGRIVGSPPIRYAVIDPRFIVDGQRLASVARLSLYRVRPPLRLAAAAAGVYRDGWTGEHAAYIRWSGGRGRVEVALSRMGWLRPGGAGPVHIRVGPGGGLSRVERATAEATVELPSGASRVVTLPAPKAPFRVEVDVAGTFVPAFFGGTDTRELGVRVAFRYVE